MIQGGFFDIRHRYESLSKFGDPLEKLKQIVDFEAFRCEIEGSLKFTDRLKGGRPSYDGVLMFKILVLQALYTVSDDQIEYQIKDRLSFMRFLDLDISHRVPDAKTVWLYRERLSKNGVIERLFKTFDHAIKAQGYLAMSGQIVDATIISAPRQRMTKEEKEQVKMGEIPQEWQSKPAKLVQKDRDARWVLKYRKAKESGMDIAIPLFGYKNHASIDKRYGFIRKYLVTSASCHDGQILKDLLDKENTASDVWGDTAYRSFSNEELLLKEGFRSQIHCKKPKGKPMPVNISKANGKRSTVRCRVEQVFAVQKEQMGLFIRSIGLTRATCKITLANLVYNMKRLVFWESRRAF